jgi:hypothetical protein
MNAPETTIVQRTGNVLYWFGSAIAVLLCAGAIVVAGVVINSNSLSEAIFVAGPFLILSGITWLAGRACRYVLAGA